MKRLFILMLVLFAVCGVSAQSQVDSLLQICKNAPDKQKAELYLELSHKLKNDSVQSNTYVHKAYRLAVKNSQIPLQAKALYYLGENMFNSSNYREAVPAYKKALAVYSEVKDTANIVKCHQAIGSCYSYMDQGEKAISQYLAGMKLCENDTLTTANLLWHIAAANSRMHNMNDAIAYSRKALALNSAINNYEGMACNYNELGLEYKLIRRLSPALFAFQKAKDLTKDPSLHAITLFNIAGMYLSFPDSLDKAMEYFKQSWADFKKLGMNEYEAEYRESIGVIFMKRGEYKLAINSLKRGIELNDKFKRGYKVKATCYRFLAKVYEKMGDYHAALKQTRLFMLYSDSLEQKKKYEQISNLEKRYDLEKKEGEIERLQAKQKFTLIQLQKNKQLKQLGITTALLLLLFVVFIWVKYIEKNKSNRLLETKNKIIEESEQELRILNASKNKFFSIIAHDLKNPLHTILGYSYIMNADYDRFSDDERRKFASNIHQSTNNIFRLLQNLLEWARSQTGKLNYSPSVVEYQHILDNSLGVLKSMAEQKNIEIKTGNDPELKMFADPLMIETVLRNLINNAIKFTPEGGHIEVEAKEEEGQVFVSVSDSGIGMSEEESKNLFRIDSKVRRKGTNEEEGSGLGLILCHEFVTRNNGEIWVESKPGKGSAFIFSIPAKAIA